MIEDAIIDMFLGGKALAKNAEATLAEMEARELDMVNALNKKSTRKNYDIYDYHADLELNPRIPDTTRMPTCLNDEINMTYNRRKLKGE